MTIGIPPTVFIRADGGHLVVTTNTGEPPQAQDDFYSIAPGSAVPASAGLRQQVLSDCGTLDGR